MWELKKKQLENKNFSFKEQKMKINKNTNICDNNLKKNKSFFFNNFNIPKGRFANIYSKIKKGIKVVNSLINLIQQNTKKVIS